MERLHCTVRIHGAVWRYYVVPEDDPRLEGNEAITSNGSVYLSDAISPERIDGVIAHEDIHVALAELSNPAAAQLLGCDEDDAKDAEERLASHLGPLLAQMRRSRRVRRAK